MMKIKLVAPAQTVLQFAAGRPDKTTRFAPATVYTRTRGDKYLYNYRSANNERKAKAIRQLDSGYR